MKIERIAGTATLLVVLAAGSVAGADDVEDAREEPGAEERTALPEAEAEAPPEPEEEREKARRRVDRALERLDNEPSLAELQRAALRRADADRGGADSWMSSTRWSAVLPVVKFTAEHDMERDESLDRYQDEPDRWGADTDNDLGFKITAQWKLNELVFNSDQMRVYNALADRAERREELLTVLVGYYFERRKLQAAELLDPAPDPAASLERKLRIRELTAMIDALTGGLLSSRLEEDAPR
ncbi:MAG: hypothetical protein R6V85_14090 [Polyangia bacterium]